MPLIFQENKFHFGIFSQGQKEKLQDHLKQRQIEEKEISKDELEKCDEIVSLCQWDSLPSKMMKKLDDMIYDTSLGSNEKSFIFYFVVVMFFFNYLKKNNSRKTNRQLDGLNNFEPVSGFDHK